MSDNSLKSPVTRVTKTLGEICREGGGSIQTGPFGSQLHAEDYKDDGVPIITVEHLCDGKISNENLPLVGERDYQRLIRYTLSTGDLVFSRVGSIDRCSYVSEKQDGWLFSGRCLRVRSGRGRADAKFLSYLLNSWGQRQWILNHSVGSTMACLNTRILSGVPIELPHPSAQRRIAEILGTVDEVIEHTEALIAKQQQVKVGLMHDLFTRGVTATGTLRTPPAEAPHLYQDSPLGPIPKEWAIATVGDLLSGIDAGWSPDCVEVPPPEGEWGVLKVSAVTSGIFRTQEAKTLPAHLRPIPELEVKSGDVITARANGVAELVGVTVQVQICQSKLMLSDKLLRLRPNQTAIGSFVAGVMASHNTRRQIDGLMSGSSGQRNIGQSQIRKLITARPSIEEQQRMERLIRSSESTLAAETAHLAKLRQEKQGLMQDLLTGRVSVPA